jgi:peroxiredoxin
MRFLPSLLLLFALAGLAVGQNEQSPITEKPFAYRDWTYKNLKSGGETNLREFAKGKKLVMVVYWAPWCPNWKHDVAFVQSLHEKYKDAGLGIIGVGEYDSTGKMKDFTEQYKITFPSVYESENSGARLTTAHYTQRTEAGDTRKWGSPWYVFLDPAALEQTGELTRKTTVVNGELIKQDAEKYIQQKLSGSGAAK